MDKVIDKTSAFHFTIIDNYILNQSGMNALEQIVYVHLKKHSSQSNKCFPGINNLAKSLDSSSNTIRKALKSLKDKGFIDIEQRFNNSNEYTLLPYPEYKAEIEEADGMPPKEAGIGLILKAYQENINPLYGSMEREKLLEWYNTFEEKGEILMKAIELTVMNGVRRINYIETILLNWHQSGARTLEQCEASQREWEKKRSSERNGIGNIGKGQGERPRKRGDFSKYGDREM